MSDEELAVSILTSCGCVRAQGGAGLAWTGDATAEEKAIRVAAGHSGRPRLLSIMLGLIRTAKTDSR